MSCGFTGCTNPGAWFVRALLHAPGRPSVHILMGQVCAVCHARLQQADQPGKLLHEEWGLVFTCVTRGTYMRAITDFTFAANDMEVNFDSPDLKRRKP